jgi:chemotaxis response regulator CheB
MTPDGASATRLRVLIVDQHEVSRAAIRALLVTEGLEVIGDVPDGKGAVKLGRALTPDVAVIDLGIGVRQAVELARTLERLQSLPAVLLTSSDCLNEDVGGYPFIAKADICATELRSALKSPNEPGDVTTAKHRSHHRQDGQDADPFSIINSLHMRSHVRIRPFFRTPALRW